MAEKKELATTEKTTFKDLLENKLDNIQEALPQNFNKQRFAQNCIALLNDNAAMFKEYSQTEIMSGLLKGSFLGLDFFQKECYLIPYGKKLQYQTSYTGQMKLAKKYSARPIKEIYAKLIKEGDFFEEVITNGEQGINFKPKPLNDGKIIGAFAVVLYKDGGMNYEAMGVSDLENTRKHSKAANSPAWKDFTGEMYKKTVIRRLCKYIQLDFENPSQIEAYEEEAAIETDLQKINENEVALEANAIDFVEDEDK